MLNPAQPDTNPNWPEAIATVLECHYDMRVGQALAFGVPADKHFRIRYNYFADGTPPHRRVLLRHSSPAKHALPHPLQP